jgi:hypothetical protein
MLWTMIDNRLFIPFVIVAGVLSIALTALAIFTM